MRMKPARVCLSMGKCFWYRDRRHSTLGGVCPHEYEQSHHPDTRSNTIQFPWGKITIRLLCKTTDYSKAKAFNTNQAQWLLDNPG